MEQDWTGNIPTVVYFVVGLGGVAGALLAMLKLKEALVPDTNSQVKKDIASIRADIHDIRARVGMLELDVARIDQPSIAKRFDALESKIDKLYDFLLERLTKLPS
jgi:rubrerythrin